MNRPSSAVIAALVLWGGLVGMATAHFHHHHGDDHDLRWHDADDDGLPAAGGASRRTSSLRQAAARNLEQDPTSDELIAGDEWDEAETMDRMPMGEEGADGTFHVGGVAYESQSAYIDSGDRCSTRVPSPDEMRQNAVEIQEFQDQLNLDDMAHVRRHLQSTIVIRINYVIISNSTGGGYISDKTLRAQTRVLNTAFAPQFSFQAYNVLRINNDLFHSNCRLYGKQFKTLYRQGGPETLNIFTCNGAGVLGFSNLPLNGGAQSPTDGVVIAHHTLPGRSTGAYNLGHVRIVNVVSSCLTH
jgi:hypothetical protein